MRNRSITGLPSGLQKFWVGKKFRTHEWSQRNYGFDVVVEYREEQARAYDAIQIPPRYIGAIKNRIDFNAIFLSIHARYFDPRTPKDQDFVMVWSNERGENGELSFPRVAPNNPDEPNDILYSLGLDDYEFDEDEDLKERFDELKGNYNDCPDIPGMAIEHDTNRDDVLIYDNGKFDEPEWLTDNNGNCELPF